MMSSINNDFLNKETAHNLVVEMWNSIAENAEEITSKDLYDMKRDAFSKLISKYKLIYIYDIESNRSNCFACIFYNKNFEKDCGECPFSKHEKIMPTVSKYNTYCEDSVKSPYRKICDLDSLVYLKSSHSCNSILLIKNREFSEWQMRCFKKHCIEICDMFIE